MLQPRPLDPSSIDRALTTTDAALHQVEDRLAALQERQAAFLAHRVDGVETVLPLSANDDTDKVGKSSADKVDLREIVDVDVVELDFDDRFAEFASTGEDEDARRWLIG